jgi:hypothetical protein
MSTLKRVFQGLFYKNGQFSKTAFFLSLATVILLFLWPFQSLFAGTTLLGWWVIPEFSSSAATAVIGCLATLYLFNHSKLVSSQTPEGLAELREKIDIVVDSFDRRDDGDR